MPRSSNIVKLLERLHGALDELDQMNVGTARRQLVEVAAELRGTACALQREEEFIV